MKANNKEFKVGRTAAGRCFLSSAALFKERKEMLKKRDESSQSTRRRLNGIHAEREEKRIRNIYLKKRKKD